MPLSELQEFAAVNDIDPELSMVLKFGDTEVVVAMIDFDRSTYADGKTRILLNLVERES